MKTLRKGDRGAGVRMLQAALNAGGADPELTPDGNFGGKTEDAVEALQTSLQLYPDGIVGRRTWSALGIEKAPEREQAPYDWERVPADRHNGGYSNFKLRTDVAAQYMMVRERVLAAGGIIPSSGGRRSLTAKVSSTRSATSLHYIGRALDLHVYSGMVDPRTDPLVVTKDPERARAWIVYVRCAAVASAPLQTLQAFTYEMTEVQVAGYFLNLTELFAEHGFTGIRARRSFLSSAPGKNNGAAEWWHFQCETGLVKGETTFGSELLQMYTEAEASGTPPWDYRDRTFKNGYF